MIAIQEYSETRTATQIERTQIHLTPAGVDENGNELTRGTISGNLLDADGAVLRQIECEMTPEEYSEWGEDDEYPTLLLIEKNGLIAA